MGAYWELKEGVSTVWRVVYLVDDSEKTQGTPIICLSDQILCDPDLR